MTERLNKKIKETASPEGLAGSFINFIDTINRSGTIIDAEKMTNQYFSFGEESKAEKDGLASMVCVHIFGNNEEKIKILKATIDDQAVSLNGDVGYLLDDGRIEKQEVKILSNDPRNRMSFSSKTVYVFGMTAEEIIDYSNMYAEPDDSFDN